MKAGSSFGAPETPPPIEVLLFFYVVNFVDQLQIKKKVSVCVPCKKWSSIALLVQCVLKIRTAVRKRGSLELSESVAQAYLYYDWSLGRFQIVASQFDSYYPLEPKTIWKCLQKPEFIENSQPPDVRITLESMFFLLRSSTGFMMEGLHKELCTIHLYDFLEATVWKIDALKNYEVPTEALPMLLSKFSVSSGALFQLQLPAVPERSTSIPDANGNVTRAVEVLESKPGDTSVYYDFVKSLLRLWLCSTENDWGTR